MSRYVTTSFGADALKIPSDVDVVAAVNRAYTQLTNGYQELRTIIGQYTVVAGSSKAVEMKQLAVELNDWKKRIITFFAQRGASVPPVIDYTALVLLPFPFNLASWWKSNVTSTSQRTQIYWDMKRFQVEMANYGSRLTALTGTKLVWAIPSKDPAKEPGPGDKIIFFGWSLLKIGAVGLGLWYGSKWLYAHTASTYPKNRLPKYAGGKRGTK